MTIIRWNSPAHLVNVLNNLYGDSHQEIDKKDCDCIPAANTIENNNGFVIELAVPGYDKKDIRISLDNNVLSIANDSEETPESEVKYLRREFGYGSFRRSFALPKSIDNDKISADYKNGVLAVTLPKRSQENQRVNREIKVG